MREHQRRTPTGLPDLFILFHIHRIMNRIRKWFAFQLEELGEAMILRAYIIESRFRQAKHSDRSVLILISINSLLAQVSVSQRFLTIVCSLIHRTVVHSNRLAVHKTI